ncbi:alginate O-acetyltransferase complex protein AlgJ [Marinobacter pelagius]|uniref:Probable alginate O-acetylase AlgJ n=1 Tax=Marinobacter pelagius TaxID=379482 RepID=A0A366GWZ9_9GAMM|nr:alginate O-acetyltransferase [Marinobacter pelagius]RBP31840.1 alginate O-acetyltransferase complex protein AlgJ [Marinobacter pelagius]
MTRTSKKLTAGLFIVTVLTLGGLSLRSLANYGAAEKLDPINGELARDLESHYDDQFPVRDLGTNIWAAINYLVFDEGRPGVTIGRDNWLFTDEELFPATDNPELIDTNLERVAEVSNFLRARDIPLVVLVVPSKARVYTEKLGDTRPAPEMQALYPRFLERLKSEGVDAPDLLGELERAQVEGTQVFLRTDTHWSPAGAEVFARHASGFIRHSLDKQSWGEQTFVTTLGEPIRHEGDLLNYLPLDPLFEHLAPRPDRFNKRETVKAKSDESASDLLFSEQQTDLVLVGTSYSANPLWDFPGALRRYLGKDLINLAEEGQGPFEPMTEYLQSEEFRTNRPSLVLWEFPERYLAQPIESEQALAWFGNNSHQLAAATNRNPSISEEH